MLAQALTALTAAGDTALTRAPATDVPTLSGTRVLADIPVPVDIPVLPADGSADPR
ncbi:hypothetical protein [Streptomyces albipurpureus]|uniref:Uncharacterized protein n=1 Tax=Streptomyces albipurpureus TaxID=2897419 RepID=A0ABT0UKT9_9ACTN|nr:hypothetical protein [Streptomyces sp. CWNU-1]MCM2388715.1 hypothetical protein [Streptomyces sp. CWNU-1]